MLHPPHPNPANATGTPARVLTMSSLGQLGRFGNQMLQYSFLRICAKQAEAQAQCPAWPGQHLFGLNDPPISLQLPAAIERCDNAPNVFDALPEYIPYIERLTQSNSCRIDAESLERGLHGVDLWGFFQIHTRHLNRHRDFIRSLFEPADDLRDALEQASAALRARGNTIIGIHMRQGDFLELPLFGFTYPVPASWWREWLEPVWPKCDRPVLFLCSDDLDSVRSQFAAYQPVTGRDLLPNLPPRLREFDFYLDFFLLTQCDVLGISNSTFSFAAALLNRRATAFYRSHWDFRTRFIPFDPWNAEPLLYYGGDQPKLFKSFRDALEIARATGGLPDVARCGYVYPRERIKMKLNRAKTAYNTAGLAGLFKSLRHRLPI